MDRLDCQALTDSRASQVWMDWMGKREIEGCRDCLALMAASASKGQKETREGLDSVGSKETLGCRALLVSREILGCGEPRVTVAGRDWMV